jgi:hypothetical protein
MCHISACFDFSLEIVILGEIHLQATRIMMIEQTKLQDWLKTALSIQQVWLSRCRRTLCQLRVSCIVFMKSSSQKISHRTIILGATIYS